MEEGGSGIYAFVKGRPTQGHLLPQACRCS